MELMLSKASNGWVVYLLLLFGLATVSRSDLISEQLGLAVYRVARSSILVLYAGLSIFYTLGIELTFRRLESRRDVYEAGIAYGLHFSWGFGVPILLSVLLSHFSTPGSNVITALALGLSALRLNWEAVALRFSSVRECRSGYDRRIETFVAGPVFENNTAAAKKSVTSTGPYAEMRHPGFAAHILQQMANALLVSAFFSAGDNHATQVLRNTQVAPSGLETVAFASLVLGISAALAYLVFDGAAASEEKSLRKIPAYQEYMDRVPTRFSLLSYSRDESWTADVMGLLHGVMIHGSLRAAYFGLVAAIQGVGLEYVDPVKEPEVVDRVLSATGDKGTFIEDLAACPAWRPIYSIESVGVPLAKDLRGRLANVLTALKIDERIPGIVDSALEDLKTRLEAKGDTLALLDHREACHLTFDVFFRLLTDRVPDIREVSIALKAVEEWKAEIALKKHAGEAAKEPVVSLMREALRESEFFSDIGASYSPDDISDLSCVMQPLVVSPLINFPDLFVGAKELLSESPEWIARGAESEEVADMILLEAIRLRHPFPVLERFVKTSKDERKFNFPGSQRFKAGTQVFIEHDNRAQLKDSKFDPERWREYVLLGKNHVTASVKTCPYKAIPFGAGPRRCAGQNLARAILKRTLRWALKQFPMRNQKDHAETEAVSSTWSWERFEPGRGHKYTGRHNDENDQDTDLPYMVYRLLQILGCSFVIGFKRRLGVSA